MCCLEFVGPPILPARQPSTLLAADRHPCNCTPVYSAIMAVYICPSSPSQSFFSSLPHHHCSTQSRRQTLSHVSHPAASIAFSAIQHPYTPCCPQPSRCHPFTPPPTTITPTQGMFVVHGQ